MKNLSLKKERGRYRNFGKTLIFQAIIALSAISIPVPQAAADSETVHVSCGYENFIRGMTCSTYNDVTIDMTRVLTVELMENAFDDYGSLRIVSPGGTVRTIESSRGCPDIGSIPPQDITSYFGSSGAYRVRLISSDDPACGDTMGGWANLRITYKLCQGNDAPRCETPGECQTGPGECIVEDDKELCRYPLSKDTCEADGNSCTYDVCKSADEGISAFCSAGPNVCGGMVPCNRLADDPSTPDNDETKTCTFCHLALVADRIIDFLIKLASTLALLAFITAGMLYILSNGNPERRNAARGYVKNIIKGYAIVFLGWLIVDFILSAWGFMDPVGGEWNVICAAFSLF